LETITDKAIDDETKCIWITIMPQGQKDMDSDIQQAITTELTVGGFRGTAVATRNPWANFYSMVLCTAKMIDRTRKKQTGRQQVVNQQRRTPNDTRNARNTSHSYTLNQLYWSQHGHETRSAVQGRRLEAVDCCTANKDEGTGSSEAQSMFSKYCPFK
jgi:hypothetical protein